MVMVRSRNIDVMLSDVFAELRMQPLTREQRAIFDEIGLAASILADLPSADRQAAIAALVELAETQTRNKDAVFFLD